MDQIQASAHPTSAQSSAIISKKSSTKKLFFLFILIIIILLTVLAGVYFISTFKKDSQVSTTGSGSVFTTPTDQFQGLIEKVNGNNLIVSYTKPTPGTPENDISYKFNVLINESTTVVSERETSPLDNSDNSPSGNSHSLANLSPGQVITVVADVDLRQITSNFITAKSIIVSPGLTIFIGRIEDISGNELLVKSGPPSVSAEKTYKIIVVNETEIVNSKILNDSSKEAGLKLNLTDLTPGATILVNTVGDINRVNETEALKIELIRNL